MILNEKLKDWKIILASKSPRRQQILRELGIKFEVLSGEVAEDFPLKLRKEEIARYLAGKKCMAFERIIDENTILITADTIVCIDDMVLNKPENYQDAERMLKLLSGRKHEVITGVCLKTLKKSILFHSRTDVYFKPLLEEEIKYYLTLYQPYDKAGAYGVQEWIGLIGLERIDGSYHNVVGLPVQELYRQLHDLING